MKRDDITSAPGVGANSGKIVKAGVCAPRESCSQELSKGRKFNLVGSEGK